ncbi:MAG: Fic family protein [Gammaproteobacteria bacterium]|nr:Fic family protein [Gammaproteobacteria bacterium]MDE0280839.1 Fic family protein [Gammaproteobacteria bacterium]MDE0713332.1 Fic family protein [Gammaproteobacteria bacterium]MYH91038.1 cell filamentation protein Fic [Gammaproteobacteria bacterium]
MPYQRDPDAGPYDAESDPYIDPNGVLKNILGIRNTPDLNKAEANLSYLRAQELETSPLPGNFDLDHLRKIHKHLFGDVYPWAGEIRQIDIGRGNDLFAHHVHIEKEAGKLFRQLADENHLKGMDAEKFSERAGHYLGEINALHPFREGNGRSQRAFIGQVAREAGYEIEWSRISREDKTRGSIESFYGDSGNLAKLIRDNLTSEKEDPSKKP